MIGCGVCGKRFRDDDKDLGRRRRLQSGRQKGRDGTASRLVTETVHSEGQMSSR